MNHRFSFGLVFLSFASVVACGTDRTIVIEQPASSTSDTDPADGGGVDSTTKSGSGDLGPECTAYLSCCEDVATQVPSLGASCDSLKTSIQNAEDEGVSTASYESSCKSGLSGFQGAGYCN